MPIYGARTAWGAEELLTEHRERSNKSLKNIKVITYLIFAKLLG